MLAVVGLHGCLKIREAVVHTLLDRHIDLGRSGPEHDQTATALLSTEATNVLPQLLDHLPTIGTIFHVVTVKTLGIVVIEGGLHRHNLLEFVAYRLNILLFQHLSIDGGLIGVLRIDIPTAEDDIVETGQRHDLAILQILLRGTTTHTNLVVLGHGTHRFCQSFAGHQNARHECRGNRSVADNQNSQLSFCWFYVCFVHVVYFFSIISNSSSSESIDSHSPWEGIWGWIFQPSPRSQIV